MDFTNKLARYYVDGVLASTNFAYQFNNNAPGGTNPLSIGSQNASSSANSFNGALDDLRIYNRVLSSNEIQTIYAGAATLPQIIPIAVAAAAKLPCQPVTPS